MQGPSRKGTEEEIALRKALIAAAKSGKSLEEVLSPRSAEVLSAQESPGISCRLSPTATPLPASKSLASLSAAVLEGSHKDGHHPVVVCSTSLSSLPPRSSSKACLHYRQSRYRRRLQDGDANFETWEVCIEACCYLRCFFQSRMLGLARLEKRTLIVKLWLSKLSEFVWASIIYT